MARIGTLLDTFGRPEDRVEIIRRSKKTTRIRRSTHNGRSWSPADQLVATELILDDGGQRFDQHAQNPGHATYLGLAGTPQARLKIQRVYAVITKAQVYLGDNTWSDLQVCFVNFLPAKRARKTRPPQRVFRPCERQVIRACLTR